MKRVKLFIVNTDQEMVDQLTQLLYLQENLQIDVIGKANSFANAYNHTELKNSDVVLISAYLPDQMGIDLVSNIKSNYPNIHILATVTQNTYNLEEICRQKGAERILRLPTSMRKIVEAIQEVTGLKQIEEKEESRNKGENKNMFQNLDETIESLSKWISDKMKTADVHETQILPQMIQELRELIHLKNELT